MFITFEGIDGSGKTTQALKLKSWLEGQGREVLYTFEPGGCELCKGIRELLLSNSIKDDIARLILFLGDRKLHVESVIEPALKAGKIVICDRYNDSSIAYQSASGLDYKFVREFVKSFNFIEPDMTFMFDIKAEDALMRLEGRDGVGRICHQNIKVRKNGNNLSILSLKWVFLWWIVLMMLRI